MKPNWKGKSNGEFADPYPDPAPLRIPQHLTSNQFQMEASPGFGNGCGFSEESNTNSATASRKRPSLSLFKMAILTILSLTLLFSIGTFRLSSDLNQWNRIVLRRIEADISELKNFTEFPGLPTSTTTDPAVSFESETATQNTAMYSYADSSTSNKETSTPYTAAYTFISTTTTEIPKSTATVTTTSTNLVTMEPDTPPTSTSPTEAPKVECIEPHFVTPEVPCSDKSCITPLILFMQEAYTRNRTHYCRPSCSNPIYYQAKLVYAYKPQRIVEFVGFGTSRRNATDSAIYEALKCLYPDKTAEFVAPNDGWFNELPTFCFNTTDSGYIEYPES